MKRIFLVLFAAIALFSFGCATGPAPDSEIKIAIVHVNDTHGHPLSFDNYPMKDVAGFPALATLLDQTRAEYPNTLFFDAGDFNTGRPESNFFKAEPDIKAFNAMKLDAGVLGNHEFDNELSVLEAQKKLATYPFISANVKTKAGAYIADAPYIIKKLGGIKIGIFGLTTKETEKIGSPSIVKDLVFLDEIDTAKAMVKQLRTNEKCDVVIALVHMGLGETDTPGSRGLAKAVSGIDLIIDGHSHSYINAPVVINNTPIVQAHQWALHVGKGILTVKNGKVTGFEWAPISMNHNTKEGPVGPQFAKQTALEKMLKVYADQVETLLSVKIGTATETFPNNMSRKAETALGNIVSDSMKAFTLAHGVDFAFNNGGGIRADLPVGDITKKTAYTILPFDNSVTVVKLKGSAVQALFNFAATTIGKGGFPQLSSGVTATFNSKTGQCDELLINGKPVDPDKVYTIATNSYLATGGDGYEAFKNALSSYETSLFQRDVFISYIEGLNKPISPKLEGRIKIVE